MSDPMTPDELQACRERYDREADKLLRYQTAVENARADVPRLLATIAARDEDIRRIAEALGRMHEADGHAPFPASADELVRRAGELTRAEEERGDALAALAESRFAALMAYGVRGGPGAWRWASDPEGTILDTAAAWERMLAEMREAHANGVCAAGGMPCDDCDDNATAERKPTTWQPHPDGGEFLTVEGKPGVHLGVWDNPHYGPTWSAAFDGKGCFPRHADTIEQAKADAIAHAEAELCSIIGSGVQAAHVLAELRGSAVDVPEFQCAAAPAPAGRKPVAGWEVGHVPGYSARRAAPILRGGPIAVRATENGWEMIAESDEPDVDTALQIISWPAADLRSAQLAAEDALWSIADAINALRGGR